MIRKILALAFFSAIALAGCSGNSSSANGGGTAQAVADAATKAAYNNDIAGVTANMDAALKGQVTRAQVGTLSDKMHQMGDYKGLTFVGSDVNKNEYTYRAEFTNRSTTVAVRLDPDGKLSAYRVDMPK
ncbi:MAG TPA: hypothetical protein VIG51_02205 [Candidatus Baltobacteraceae bacterium]|jgi:PBP1b-binding outer membrane lipoprotein LpoB